ncbi:hypothetical protein HDU78_003452 [Chytriomyces hyalinus]|nr:hypothetical protein HDU78_003452 [Chytriomyces hyalinus]
MKDTPIPVLMRRKRVSIDRAMDAVFEISNKRKQDCGVKEVQELVLRKMGSSGRVWTTDFTSQKMKATDGETSMAYTGVARHYERAIEKFLLILKRSM